MVYWMKLEEEFFTRDIGELYSHIRENSPERFERIMESLKKVILPIMLDPNPEVRKTLVGHLQKQVFQGKLHGGFMGDAQLFLQVKEGKCIENFYVRDMPDEYAGHPVERAYNFICLAEK